LIYADNVFGEKTPEELSSQLFDWHNSFQQSDGTLIIFVLLGKNPTSEWRYLESSPSASIFNLGILKFRRRLL